MVFGKRRREEEEFASQNQSNTNMIHDLDGDSFEDEQNCEEIDIDRGKSGKEIKSEKVKPMEVDSKMKLLLAEVTLLGAAPGKNPGGSKGWSCNHCKNQSTSSYTRFHYHFFGAPPDKKSSDSTMPSINE